MRQAEFWLNILVYYLFFGLLYLIFNSRKVSVTVGSILWCIIGIANYYVLSFKGAPIVPSDIMLSTDGSERGGKLHIQHTANFCMECFIPAIVSGCIMALSVFKEADLEKAYCYVGSNWSA